MMPPFLRPQRILRLSAAAAILAVLGALALLPASPSLLPALPGGCMFHKLSGLPCVFCGGTRATSALLHGNLERAWYLNPLALPVVAMLLITAAICLLEAARNRPLLDWPRFFKRARPLLPIVFIGLLILWFPHVWGALRASKTELIDLRNPIARTLHDNFHNPR